ncbi:MAG: 4-hydroxythreonine-4-phosphate dehydrogenase PdxA [Pirellulales bacterium]
MSPPPTSPVSAADRPVVLLTCGDPAGIGPEIIWLAWAATPAHTHARLRVVGDVGLLAATLQGRRGLPDLGITPISADDPRESRRDELLVIEAGTLGFATEPVPLATITAAGGRAAASAVLAAHDLVHRGLAHAIVTGPLHKEALHAAGYDVPGHTELLARACGLPDDAASMMLWLPSLAAGLGVVHVTLHESLRTAIARLSSAGIVAAGQRLAALLAPLLGRPPRIAVAALNPHAGEGGLFGDEEPRLVVPAVAALQAAGIDAAGPLPADTLFLRASRGEFDGVVALYHDQGHIPIKLLGMHRAVNITLGLPLVRTSVAHGTGFDIVGTGAADPASMLAAIDAAERLVHAGWPVA